MTKAQAALKLLVAELVMSGNNTSTDYGWPAANAAAAEALEALELQLLNGNIQPQLTGRLLARVVETDNFDGDYPNERFVNLFEMSKEQAQSVTNAINSAAGLQSPRFWKVVDNDYTLQPGFEP